MKFGRDKARKQGFFFFFPFFTHLDSPHIKAFFDTSDLFDSRFFLHKEGVISSCLVCYTMVMMTKDEPKIVVPLQKH